MGWKVLEKIGDIFVGLNAVLAGGTAVALRIGHRVSNDLDFFTSEDFYNESIISAIRKTGLPFKVISDSEGTFIAEIGGIKVSLLRYEYPFFDRTLKFEGIRIAGLLDIAAMKIIAVCQRGTKRDFIDLYALLQSTPFHKIARHMARRFGAERINPVHIGKSLVYFSDAESDPEPAYIRGRQIKWEAVKKFFKAHVRQFVLDLDVEL